MIKKEQLKSVAHGIFLKQELEADPLYMLQMTNPTAIYSYETAMYLNGLISNKPDCHIVTVLKGHLLSNKHRENYVMRMDMPCFHEVGKYVIVDEFDNPIVIYDRERCICDLIKYPQYINEN